jgi:hypothetical protein
MKRANPAKLRTALEVANGLAKAGVMFVAMPVMDDEDHGELLLMSAKRMAAIAIEAETEESENEHD